MKSHSIWRTSGRRFIYTFAGVFVFLFCFFAYGAEANAATCTFTAASSTDWNTDANWSCGHEPLVSDDVVLPLGLATTTVMSADATAQSVTIQTGAILNLNGNTLEVNGSWADTGMLIPAVGTVKFIGTALATIGTEPNFYRLEVDKTFGALQLAGNVTTTGNITLTNGDFDLTGFKISAGGNITATAGVFIGTGLVDLYNGAGDQYITGITEFYNLSMSKVGNSVICSAPITVSSTFMTSGGGIFNTQSNTFNVVGESEIGLGTVVTSTSGTINFQGYVTSSGSIGTWTGAVNFLSSSTNNGMIDAGNAGGTINFSSTTTNNGMFDVHFGEMTANGGLVNNGTISGGSLSGKLVINSLWQQNGLFNKQTGEVEFGGGINQTIPGEDYHQFTVNKTGGVATLIGTATSSNLFSLNAGTLSLNSNQWIAQGNWNNGGGTINTSTGGAVVFDGAFTQNVQSTIFPNIIVQKTANQVVQTGNVTSTGNITINSGHWSADVYDFSASSTAYVAAGCSLVATNGNLTFWNVTSTGTMGVTNGTLTFNATATNNGVFNLGQTLATFNSDIVNNATINVAAADVYVYGNWSPAGIFNSGTSKVIFAGSYAHVIPAFTYYNLTIDKSAIGDTVTLAGHVTTTSDFYIAQGTVNAGSNWITTGRIWNKDVNNAVFNPGTGTVELTGTSMGQVKNDGNFYNLIINQANWTFSVLSDVTVLNDFTKSGASRFQTSAYNLYVTGTTMITAGAVSSTSGNYVFDGAVSSTGGIESDSGNFTFNNTYVNNGSLYAGSGNLIHSATATNNGLYDLESANATTTAEFNSTGIFDLGSGTFAGNQNMNFLAGSEVASGGTLRLYGANDQTILGFEPTGLWNLQSTKTAGNIITNADINITGNLDMAGGGATLLTGGTSMTVTGTTMIASGDTVSSTAGVLNFNGTFTNSGDLLSDGNVNIGGFATNGGMIDINAPGDLVFSATTSNNGTIDHENGSVVTFQGNFINNNTFISSGQVYFQHDWSIAGSVTPNTNSVFTFNGTGDQKVPATMDATTFEVNKVSGSAILQGNVSITDVNLILGTLDLNGYTLNLYDDWNNIGGVLTGNGTVNVRGTVTQTISTEPNFYNLLINKTAGSAVLSGNVTTTNSFTLTNGTLNVGSHRYAVSGSTYQNNGLITITSGKIVHAASSTKITDGTGAEVATLTTPAKLWVTVEDSNINLDASVAEIFAIVVTAGTDSETIYLEETGLATGVFRNTSTIYVVSSQTIVPGNGQLSIASDAIGNTTYTDGQDASDTRSDTVSIIYVGPASTPAGGGGGGGSGSLPPVVSTPSYDEATQARLDNLAEIGVNVHTLVKLQNDGDPETQYDSALYYVATDGRRHAFPNSKIYFTWYKDFSGVKEISLEKLSSIPLGANVTYKPGVRMVKFTTDDKVYAVSKGGVLHWITTEAAAIELYGEMWNENIDDISDAFYLDYGFSDDSIAGIADFDPVAHEASVTYPSDSLR